MQPKATIHNLLAGTVADLIRRWHTLLTADLLVKALVFTVVSPAVAAAWRGYLYWTGRPVLTDAEIVNFFVNPLGWVALVFLGGAGVATLALGQGALMWIAGGRTVPGAAGAITSVIVAFRCWPSLFGLSAIIITALMVTASPFVIAAALTYRVLLTEHDINYYLAARPPVFLTAVGIGVTLLAGLAAAWLLLALRWAMALPVMILEDCQPRESLRRSASLTRGHYSYMLRGGAVWLATLWVFSACVTIVLLLTARVLLGNAGDTLWRVALMTGAAVLFWSLGQLLVAVVAGTSLTVALVRVYQSLGGTAVGDGTSVLRKTAGPTTVRSRWIVLGVAVAAVGAATVGAWSIQDVALQDEVIVTAHRGASAKAPENTLAAFTLAIEAGADFIELDVQETRDGRVAVVHDQDLLRFGGPPTKVWDATLAELQATDLADGSDVRFRGESVPELGQVLELARGQIGVNIELKYYGHDDQLEARVIELIESHGMEDRVVVMSLHAPGVQKVRALRPNWTVGLLATKTLGNLRLADVDFLAVHHTLATPAFVRAAHARGQQVHVWTVNDPVLMSSLISRGVDALITDDPALARHVIAERAELTLIERVLLDLTVRLGLNPQPSSPVPDRP